MEKGKTHIQTLIFKILTTFEISSYGEVYKSKHKKTNMEVASKVMTVTRKSELEEVQMEVGILKECKSPYIVAYFGSFVIPAKQELWV